MSEGITRTADVRSLSSFPPREITWLLPDALAQRIPIGCLTLLAGGPGSGKSTWAIAIAARLTKQGDEVLFVGAEDGASQVLTPRVLAAGGDPDKCHLLRIRTPSGFDLPMLPEDVPLIEHAARGKALIIVDTLAGHISGEVDSHSDQSLRRALLPFSQMLEDRRVPALAIMHQHKNAKSTSLLNSINGSVAFGGVARSVLVFGRVKGQDEDARGIFHAKSNYSKRQAPMLTQVRVEKNVHDYVPEMSACDVGELSPMLSSDDLL